jgi:hypothetical protein
VVQTLGLRYILSIGIHLEYIARPIFLANARGKHKTGRHLRRSFERDDALEVVNLGLSVLNPVSELHLTLKTPF